MSRKEMTWKISTLRSAPPSMRCKQGRSSRAALFTTLNRRLVSLEFIRTVFLWVQKATCRLENMKLVVCRRTVAQ